MFRIENGRECFWQWDANQRLIVDDAAITEVHFCNKTDDCALVCEVFTENGKRLVNVPNILLQQDWKIRAYAYLLDHTVVEDSFKVCARSKPADYIYKETEIRRVEDIAAETAEGVAYDMALEVTTDFLEEIFGDEYFYEVLAEQVADEIPYEVHIGDKQPTDKDIKIWVDTTDKEQVATEKYVDDAIANVDLSGCMEKPAKDAAGYMILPALNHLGEQTTVRVSYTPLSYALAPYSSGGILKTNEPRVENDCANKQYVDDAIAAAITEVENGTY